MGAMREHLGDSPATLRASDRNGIRGCPSLAGKPASLTSWQPQDGVPITSSGHQTAGLPEAVNSWLDLG